ncbi:MAG: polysaccharide pyruvyl transferase family protein [Flavobacterium sp.]|uniref:polysaccharide pyruvyl transferase family protein n=1 Tax=Flavobacterium sp. TaxID=239 RepID=UPI0022CC353F|nr:polysaccharide pyruvyl transferase family protein [Flavobacterium sp.]MCZ8298006.1 polysaccharide pyruvyl transferase family protein [Flavobacterium sp.]
MKILFFFHGGSLNRGCEAIVRSGVALIKKSHPEVTVDLASFNPDTDRHIPMLDSIFHDYNHQIKRFSWEWFQHLFYLKVFKDDRFAYRIIHREIIQRAAHYDVILSIGGDNYCYGEQQGIYEVDRCIKASGKKLVLWGASIGEEDLTPAKIEDLKQFDLLLVRETLTYEVLKRHGISRVQLCADGAFTMEQEQLPLPEGWQEGNTIGFNTSPLVIRKNPASKQAALDLVQHILDTTDMTIAFTPHVIEPGNDDYECLAEFYEIFKASGRVLLLPNHLNAIQYKGYIARMRFFIGARTHATIAAYSTLVPTMVLGYSVKSKGIAKDIFGEERLVLNLAEISDSAKLIAKFEEMKRDESDLRTVLATRIPEIKKMSQKAVDYLFELLKN